jgi:hypothetical protein
MVYFLQRIAKLLYEENDGDIRSHCLVFPSRRAGLYFLKYYAALLDRPVWSPSILTINEFFGSFSELTVADNEILLFELYKVYRELNKSAESFDEFYFWGDMLLNDFDDIDKNMVNASVLFRNVQDFKNIDYLFGDIDREQAEIIKKFWKNFEPEKQSPQKTGFISIWSLLYDLYTGFKSILRSGNLAYEGMILRDVADRYLSGNLPEINWDNVHFIGFNALNNCELSFMKKLRDEGRAKFYWDYDNSYIRTGKLNSAGRFMAGNIKELGNDMPDDWNYDTLLTASDESISRKIIATTSDIAQVKLIPELLGSLQDITSENAHHTAVILADENLIVPVLTSLPGKIGDINITMGYPLKMTGVYSLIRHLLNLQRNSSVENGKTWFGYSEVLEILRHQLIGNLIEKDKDQIINEINENNLVRMQSDFLCRSEILKTIFTKPVNPLQLSDYLKEILSVIPAGVGRDTEVSPDQVMQKRLINEFIFSVMKSLNRLETILNYPGFSFRNETYIRILDKVLRSQSVPFTGEPLSGIQIMGFLETRALDFRNVILLSVNEGILPSVSSGSSFIPFSIREAFDLPVINHQESIYAYHFFRLLHRAENVTFIHNSDSTGLRTGEMSRFLTQLKYEQIIKPTVLNLSFDIRTPASIGSEVLKRQFHIKRLQSLYSDSTSKAVLSPTAINTWLNCRMRFYYRYVSGLKEPEVISPEIDHAIFGQIMHHIMKRIYDAYLNSEITVDTIDSVLKDQSQLNYAIDLAIADNYSPEIMRPLSGNDVIIKDILFIYLQKILAADRSFAPFTITGLEQSFTFMFPFQSDGENFIVRTGGNIDRIDRLKGRVRIVDYKTGETAQKISSIDDLFVDDRKKEPDGWLQTLLYCEAYLIENPEAGLRPSIYKIKELSTDNFSDYLIIREDKNSEIILDDYSRVRKSFLDGLRGVVTAIFSVEEPFRMTSNTSKCGYCPYKGLCLR